MTDSTKANSTVNQKGPPTQAELDAFGGLTALEYATVQAFTDPTAPTFNRKRASLLAAGYADAYATGQSGKVFGRERVQAAIRRRLDRVENAVDLHRGDFVKRALEQSDAWLGDERKPKIDEHIGVGGVVVDRERRPSTAETKALELAGRAAGLVGDEAGPRVQVQNFVITMPSKRETGEEWLHRHRDGTFGAREIAPQDEEPQALSPPPEDGT